MMGMMKRQPSASHWWWFESHQTSRRSPWLQSTLDELDQKIEAMLRLIEEDADSFARRAEMYYKKRPELISMVEEFYRAHRSLAERYDQVKSDSGNRLLTTLGSPFCSMKTRLEKSTSGMDQTYDSCSETCDHEESADRSLAERYDQVKSDSGNRLLTTLGSPFCSMKTRLEKSTSGMDQTYDSCSETCDREESADRSLAERYDQVKSDSGIRLLTTLGSPFCSMKTRLEKSMSGMDQTYDSCSETCDREESAESEVDDPEQEDDNVVDKETKDEEVSSEVSSDQVMKLKEELQRLEEENRIQKDQLKQKDEEKREAIRQLCIAVDVLKEENVRLRKCLLVRDSPKKSSPFEFGKLKETLLGKLFNGSQKHHPTTIVAL